MHVVCADTNLFLFPTTCNQTFQDPFRCENQVKNRHSEKESKISTSTAQHTGEITNMEFFPEILIITWVILEQEIMGMGNFTFLLV